MPLDPSIPLRSTFQPPDLGKAAVSANALMELQQNQRKVQGQNALRSLLSQPGAMDATGNPTPNAMRQIMAIDPATGMELQRNAITMQADRTRLDAAKLKRQSDIETLIDPVRDASLNAYDDVIKRGGSIEAANEAGQLALTEGIDPIKKGGALSVEEQGTLRSKFEYMPMRARALSYKDRMAQEEKAKVEKREEASAAETKRHNLASEAQTATGKTPETEVFNQWKKEHPNATADEQAKFLAGMRQEIKPVSPQIVAMKKYLEENPTASSEDIAKFSQGFSREKLDETKRHNLVIEGKVSSPQNEAMKRYLTENPDATAADITKFAQGFKKDPNAAIDDDTATKMAQQYLTGDTSVMQNIGRGAQAADNIAKVRRAIYTEADKQGMSPPDIAARVAEFGGLKSGERVLGARTAQIGMAVSEAKLMAPLALQASEKVDRTQFPALNAILLAGEKGVGDEAVVRLGVATNSLINIYARAISPTGVPTVSDKDHARELLAGSWSKGQYAAGVDQLILEMNAAAQAPGTVREEFREAVAGKKPPVSDAAGTVPKQGKPKTVNSSADYDAVEPGADYLWTDKDGVTHTLTKKKQ